MAPFTATQKKKKILHFKMYFKLIGGENLIRLIQIVSSPLLVLVRKQCHRKYSVLRNMYFF